MNFAVIDAGLVVKLLLLLLIGMGPKIALVPFLEKTKHLDAETQRAVGRRMVATAVVTAIVLFATGWLLLRLLHLSGGAVAVGGAIVLAILAINMAAGPTKKVEEVVEIREDPKQIAVYPLAVPYLLNPVGITILIIASGEIVSFASAALVLGLVLLVGAARLPDLCQHRQAVQAPEPRRLGHLRGRVRDPSYRSCCPTDGVRVGCARHHTGGHSLATASRGRAHGGRKSKQHRIRRRSRPSA
jgi:multiple antibiotic resistance protein